MSQIVLSAVTGLIQFDAIDELDNFSPLTGLTSFTVYYSLNGGAATVMTTPTVTEISAANMPGVYFLAVDEAGMVSAIGDLAVYITSTGMVGVRKQVDIINSADGATAADVWSYGTRAITDKAGFSLTQAFPTNFPSLSITAGGLVDITQTAADKVWGSATRTLSSFGTLASDVWSSGTRTLTGFSTSLAVSVWDVLESSIVTTSSIGLKVKTNLDAPVSSATSPSVAAIADGVWDEVISGHLTAGTTGLALNSAASAGDPWATAIPGAYGAGTAGKVLGDNINATISSRLATASITLTSGKVDVNDKTGFALSSAGVQAVWDALTSTFTGVGSIGKKLKDWILGSDNKVLLSADTQAGVTIPTVTTLTNSPSDSSGVTTLLTRVPSALTITTGKVDVNDKTGFSLSGTQTFNLTGNITGNLSGSVGSVSGSVGSLTTNNDKTGYAIGTAGITSSSFAVSAIDAASMAADTSAEIADTLLNRNVSGGSSTGRTVKEALWFLRNKWSTSGGVLTVYQTDDTTSGWTATITTTAGNPVSTIDPG